MGAKRGLEASFGTHRRGRGPGTGGYFLREVFVERVEAARVLGEHGASRAFVVSVSDAIRDHAFSKGALARMERALTAFMIDEHSKRGYLELLPPYLVSRQSMIAPASSGVMFGRASSMPRVAVFKDWLLAELATSGSLGSP